MSGIKEVRNHLVVKETKGLSSGNKESRIEPKEEVEIDRMIRADKLLFNVTMSAFERKKKGGGFLELNRERVNRNICV